MSEKTDEPVTYDEWKRRALVAEADLLASREERGDKNRALKRALDELTEFEGRLAKALQDRDKARRELSASRTRHKQLADLVMEVTGEAVDVTITRMEEGR